MDAIAVLQDAIGRIGERGHEVCDGLSAEHANERSRAGRTRSRGWSGTRRGWRTPTCGDALDVDDVWRNRGWQQRFELPLDPDDTGYGHTSEQVGQVRVQDGALLTGYLDDGSRSRLRSPGSPRPTLTGSSTSAGTRR